MNRIKTLIGQITKQGWVTIISIIGTVIIIALIIWLFLPKQTEQIEEITEQESEEIEFIDNATEALFTREDVLNGRYQNDVQGATMYVRNTKEVQVAVVMEDIEDDSSNLCGQIAFVKTRVAGPAVLTNSIIALFNDSINTDFNPGNIIPKYHQNLSFDRAIIQNGTAKIYLKGTFSGAHDSWCDSDLAIAQIVQTAKQFETVDVVEIYQNNVKVN